MIRAMVRRGSVVRAAVLPAALVVLGACAGSAPREGAEPEAAAPDNAYATVVIENDATRIVTVYAVRSGTRMRLGTVAGISSKEFPIRRNMLDTSGELQLMVDPLGSQERYYSDAIVVDAGDVIELRVSSLIR